MTADGAAPTRPIPPRMRGKQHGPVTRVIDPLTQGEALKPFVLLDYFDVAQSQPGAGFGLHPHSGIATLTLLIEGGLKYQDSTGAEGSLPPGSLEWMRAARGVWHGGMTEEGQRTRGFQLWVTLPPELEFAAAESQYITPDQVVHAGPARVTLGQHAGARSPVRLPRS